MSRPEMTRYHTLCQCVTCESAPSSVAVRHDGGMDSGSVAFLREALAETGWLERVRELGLALRATRSPGGLLLVGPPDDEPWHLTAHLRDEAAFSGLPQLS